MGTAWVLVARIGLALLMTGCGGGTGPTRPIGTLLPGGVADCSTSTISFAISSGMVRTFDDPNAPLLIARLRVGERVDVFVEPSVGTAVGCNSAFGPVQSWISTNAAVASVVPLSPGSESATLTGLGAGETVVLAEVLFPLQPRPGQVKSLFRAPLTYYCCGHPSCPAAPPTCTERLIERVRVVP